jgi:hypothetical protein
MLRVGQGLTAKPLEVHNFRTTHPGKGKDTPSGVT